MTSPFTVAELDRALAACLISAQRECYPEEMSRLSSGKPLLARSKLLHLSPFIDKKGTMRAEGRIDRADLPYNARHPFILPRKHPLTDMIIDEAHRTLHHGSVEQTLCELRQQYWIPRSRQAVKKKVAR
ncbi:BEL12 AG transposon polyprotein [Trichuris trichiura]|uniref:BEL12 AG transposon polyprotein n=1 Tax=Trichuris trichiura TaxID=36087 RepID=A0A077ZI44_TRITR|nr:BEL12 AG transposon polyprotein [Trichuris trichiura]